MLIYRKAIDFCACITCLNILRNFIFLGSKITANGDCGHKIKRCLLAPWTKNYDKPRQHIKKQRHYFADKGPTNQSYGFSGSHIWMWELDHKEGWAPKNWCFWTVVLEKTLESPLDCKEIKPNNPKGNYPEYSLEGLMLKLKLQYFGHLMERTDSFEKTLMLGKIEGRRRRGRQRMRWDGWMASLTQWTWIWARSRRWWKTGKWIFPTQGSNLGFPHFRQILYQLSRQGNLCSDRKVLAFVIFSHLQTLFVEKSFTML